MNLTEIAKMTQKVLHDNSPSILTAMGVSGTLATAYLTGKASFDAARRLGEGPPIENLTKREIIERIWDLYIPPIASAVVTVGCVIGSNHISSKRTAAAYSVVAVSEKMFAEYREKVIESHGERKEKLIRDEIAQDRINSNPPPAIVMGSGEVLCCESHTGRYFMSDMESLRKARNDINAKLIGDMYATLDDFYYLLKLPQTSQSGALGWESDKMLELDFSAVLTEGKPCMVFSYNYIKPL